MKSKFVVLSAMCTLCLLSCASMWAQPGQCPRNRSKIYVSRDVIKLGDDVIRVEVSHGTFGANAIFKDKQGYYVFQSDLFPVK